MLDAVEAAEQMVASAERRPPEDLFSRAYAHQVAALMHTFARTGPSSEHLELAREAASSLDNALLDGYGEFVAGHVASAMGDKTQAILHFEELARTRRHGRQSAPTGHGAVVDGARRPGVD